jgi:hypothetical protein
MRLWQSEASCVRGYLDLMAMSWGERISVFSTIIVPIIATAVFARGIQVYGHTVALYFWNGILVFWWLIPISQIMNYSRGFRAYKRGVDPLTSKVPTTHPSASRVIAWAALALFATGLALLEHHSHDYLFPIACAANFFLFLSGYMVSRSRASHSYSTMTS